MTLKRILQTSKRDNITIESDDQKVIDHFNNPASYADVVLQQLNHDRFYDSYFEGKDNMTVLDIGGNIGLFSLYLQDRAKEIYPIEPTPDHFEILTNLTSRYPNIKPVNVALHNEDGTIDFYISESNSTMNSSVNKYGKKVEIASKTLATLISDLGLDHVDFIKCDIEGSESVALTDETVGAVKDIVDTWFIETHSAGELNWTQVLQNLYDIFVRQGYKVEQVHRDALWVTKA